MSDLKKARRSLAGAVLFAMAGTLCFTAPASAQVNASVDLPEASMRELKQGSLSVEQLRKNGLAVTVKGEGGVRLVVLAFAIREGKVGKPWSSRPLPEILT